MKKLKIEDVDYLIRFINLVEMMDLNNRKLYYKNNIIKSLLKENFKIIFLENLNKEFLLNNFYIELNDKEWEKMRKKLRKIFDTINKENFYINQIDSNILNYIEENELLKKK